MIHCSSIFIFLLTGSWNLSFIEECIGCVVSPSEQVVTVGESVSISCNARPNNEPRGSIINLKLRNGDPIRGTLIFQPPVYDGAGEVIDIQYVADGYFVEYLGRKLNNLTIQINETQLKHGGTYYCTCSGKTSPPGTMNLTVFESNPILVLNEERTLTSGSVKDLDCSILFNGSSSSAVVDLTLFNASGDVLSSKSKIPLMPNVTHHHVTYSVMVDSKMEQNFTCEMKVRSMSPDGKEQLRSSSSSLRLDWSRERTTEYSPESKPQPQSSGAIYIIVAIVLVVLALLIFAYKKKKNQVKCLSRRTEDPDCNAGPLYAEVDKRERDYPVSPAKNKRSCAEEGRYQQQCGVVSELVVFDNDVYDESPRYDPKC